MATSRRTIAKANARIVLNAGRQSLLRLNAPDFSLDASSKKRIHAVELFEENGDIFLSFENYPMDFQLNTLRRFRTIANGIHELKDGDGHTISFYLVKDDYFDSFSAHLLSTLKRIQKDHPQPKSFIFGALEISDNQQHSATDETNVSRCSTGRRLPTPPAQTKPEIKSKPIVAPVPPPKPRKPTSNITDLSAKPKVYENWNFAPKKERTLEKSESTESIDSGVESNYLWMCPLCDKFNELDTPHCTSCSEEKTHNPLIIIVEIEITPTNNFASPLEPHPESRPLRKFNVDSWWCQWCCDKGIGYNAADNYFCLFCERMRKDAWQCDGCMSLQPLCVSICSSCQKWRCKHCTWVNGEPTRACAQCNRPKSSSY